MSRELQEEIKAEADGSSDESLENRLEKRYRVMLKEEWQNAASESRMMGMWVSDFARRAKELVEKIEKDE